MMGARIRIQGVGCVVQVGCFSFLLAIVVFDFLVSGDECLLGVS